MEEEKTERKKKKEREIKQKTAQGEASGQVYKGTSEIECRLRAPCYTLVPYRPVRAHISRRCTATVQFSFLLQDRNKRRGFLRILAVYCRNDIVV